MDKEKKILAIIQARVGSTRLKSKVLLDICGNPLLWHVINRTKLSRRINQVVLAVPDTPPDDVLVKFAGDQQIAIFRGSENDVLSRYLTAAQLFEGQVIMRLTADNPLVDPLLMDSVVERHLRSDASYTCTSGYPAGINVEIFSLAALEKSGKEAQQAYEREHVTPYIYQHPELFKLNRIQAEGKSNRPELRLTVDTPEDFSLVKKVFEHLYQPGRYFSTEEIIDLLDSQPGLISLNSGIRQKGLG